MRSAGKRLLGPGLVLAIVLTVPARAELVVFAEGSYLKVSDYELTGDRVRLALPDGGVLTVALDRIERVVDDEVVRAPEPPPPALAEPVLQALFSPGQPVPATPFGSEIYAAAQRHAVNPVVVAAVVRAESAFDHRAVSVKGARGLMQLMPATARRFGLADHEILDPQRNLDAGVRYLRFLLDRFDGDLTLALAAYNAGEGTVDRYGGVPPYRETRGYIERIYATLGIRQPL